jgi:predicted O-methyltransferase YrrM
MMNWKDVSGFFDSDLVYKLAVNTFPEGSVFVEIGSWMGRSTCCLGQLIKESQKSIKVYAVDTFEGSDEHIEIIKDIEENSTSLLEIFKRHTSLCGVNKIITPIKGASLDVVSKFKDESIDFIFIDASHDYENVLADITAWYPKLKPGGLIAGDDYAPCWGGVIQAVNEYFKDNTVFFLNGALQYPYSQKVWHWCNFKQSTEMKKMDVTLYAIAKNEEKNVERFVEISKKFPHTVVVDTGSTDKTVELLKEAGIEVYEHPQTREEFDFAAARNTALSYVKTDWAFSLDLNEDLDEFFPEGLGVIAEEFTAFKHERHDKEGDNEPVLSNTAHIRFHRTANYTWVNAVHETPMFIPTEKHLNEISVDTTIKITKNIQPSVDKQLFYLSICEREFKKDPTNVYYLWFIFKHYFEVKNIEKTLELGQEYLNISKPYFDPTRIDVFIMSSVALINAQDIQKAANYAFHAVSEAMNIGGDSMGRSFTHLMTIGKLTQNPNIVIFASGFAQETLSLKERTDAIDKLFLTNLDDTPATAWSGHRQFAEKLVRFMNPKVIVDLGVDYGYSTFSFALPRIGHVYGVDNFTGDDFVGTHIPEKYSYVMMKREKLHLQDNVTIIKGDFNEVATTWDKEIDILHIDGSHHYEDVKRDFETWSKFLSDNGVILLHDTCIESLNGNEYGVKKFFDELDMPKFTFTHCYGLGVVTKNPVILDYIKTNFL